jgi:TolB protein
MIQAEHLRTHLSDLAEEVTVVDLRDRALRTSRRLAAQRAAVVAIASAAAALLVAAGVAVVLSPPRALPPGGPTATTPRIDGTAFYAVPTAGGYRVSALAAGKLIEHHLVPASPDDPCVPNSITVSPDGRHLAWVTRSPNAGTEIVGILTMSRLDGSQRHEMDGVVCRIDELNWTFQPGRLLVHTTRQNLDVVTVDPATGQVEPTTDDRIVWSPNRRFRVMMDDADVVVQDTAGRSDRRVGFVGGSTCTIAVKAVSDDGGHVVLGDCRAGPERSLFGRDLLDAVTGRPVVLPARDVVVVGFVAGGNVLLRTSTELVLVTPTGKVLDRVAEPPSVARATLIGYTP